MQILTRLNKVIAHSEYGFTPVGNSAICAATHECYDDALIVEVDCVPTDIDRYDYYYVNGKFIKGDSNSTIRETHKRGKLQFWVGTKEEYLALTDEERNNLYAIITDDTTKEDIDKRITNLTERVAKLEPNTITDLPLTIGTSFGTFDLLESVFASNLVANIRISLSATDVEIVRFKTKPFSFSNAGVIATYCESYEIATASHSDGAISGFAHARSDKLVFAASKTAPTVLHVGRTETTAGYKVELLSVTKVQS